jgi:hypothetical protein
VKVGDANDDGSAGSEQELDNNLEANEARYGDKTYMHPRLRIAANAIFVFRVIWSFQTSEMGKRPRTKSHSVAVTL